MEAWDNLSNGNEILWYLSLDLVLNDRSPARYWSVAQWLMTPEIVTDLKCSPQIHSGIYLVKTTVSYSGLGVADSPCTLLDALT